MEDADVTHVDAMHYVASAGIRVGKDKTEAVRAGAKFWTSVLEYEKKGKVTSSEVELAKCTKYNRMVGSCGRQHLTRGGDVRQPRGVGVRRRKEKKNRRTRPVKKA